MSLCLCVCPFLHVKCPFSLVWVKIWFKGPLQWGSPYPSHVCGLLTALCHSVPLTLCATQCTGVEGSIPGTVLQAFSYLYPFHAVSLLEAIIGFFMKSQSQSTKFSLWSSDRWSLQEKSVFFSLGPHLLFCLIFFLDLLKLNCQVTIFFEFTRNSYMIRRS